MNQDEVIARLKEELNLPFLTEKSKPKNTAKKIIKK